MTTVSRHRAPRDHDRASSRACPSRSTARPWPLHDLIVELNDDRRRLRLRPARHGREPPGRHQEPRDLRGARRAGADHGPPRPRGHHPRARPASHEKSASSTATPSWSTTACGSRRSRRRSTPSSTRRQRFVTGEVRLRLEPGRCFVVGRRSDYSLYDYGLATYDAADSFNHADSEGFVRLWGLGVQTWAARQTPAGDGAEPRHEHPVARPLRGRARRGADGLHRQPARSTSAWPPTTSPARGPTSAASAGPACSPTTRSTTVLAALDQVEARAGRRARSRSCRPTRTSTPRSSAGSPSSPGRPGAKLHTGRSRNDQVATDLRLYAKRELGEVAGRVLDAAAGPARPGRRGGRRLPARATPTSSGPSRCCSSHHLLAHGWALGPRRRPPARHPCAASTCRRSAPARWPARRCRSIPPASPPTSASPRCSTTPSTP